MKVEIFDSREEMGSHAAIDGARLIQAALASRGEASIVVATGTSQFEVFENLVANRDIDWSRVTGFHLDEYVGLPATHPASFRKYLRERFVDRVRPPLRAFHYVSGEADPHEECCRLNGLIRGVPIDVLFAGVGENGHLAFNDPPADFQTDEPYLIVTLDERCQQQQVGEGWFKSLADVPRQAISMSIRQIMKAGAIICSVPDERKAQAIKAAVEGPVTPEVPASILQQHPHATYYLDRKAAALLTAQQR